MRAPRQVEMRVFCVMWLLVMGGIGAAGGVWVAAGGAGENEEIEEGRVGLIFKLIGSRVLSVK